MESKLDKFKEDVNFMNTVITESSELNPENSEPDKSTHPSDDYEEESFYLPYTGKAS